MDDTVLPEKPKKKRTRYKEFSRIDQNNIYTGCSIGCDYCNARRTCTFHRLQEDFSEPIFYQRRIGKMITSVPTTQYLTFMSDYSQWSPEHRKLMLEAATYSTNMLNNYLLLTRRPGRLIMLDYTKYQNIWMGVTVTCQEDLERVWMLQGNVDAAHYWINVEPMFGPIDFESYNKNTHKKIDMDRIEWVVCGALTYHGHKYDPEAEWVLKLAHQCKDLKIPFSMKKNLIDIVGPSKWIRQYPVEFPIVRRPDDATGEI